MLYFNVSLFIEFIQFYFVMKKKVSLLSLFRHDKELGFGQSNSKLYILSLLAISGFKKKNKKFYSDFR